MDFDHRNPEEKEYEISKLISGCQLTKLWKELEKCDVVCANCHRERTFGTVAKWLKATDS
jgi:hypothetical protein